MKKIFFIPLAIAAFSIFTGILFFCYLLEKNEEEANKAILMSRLFPLHKIIVSERTTKKGSEEQGYPCGRVG